NHQQVSGINFFKSLFQFAIRDLEIQEAAESGFGQVSSVARVAGIMRDQIKLFIHRGAVSGKVENDCIFRLGLSQISEYFIARNSLTGQVSENRKNPAFCGLLIGELNYLDPLIISQPALLTLQLLQE